MRRVVAAPRNAAEAVAVGVSLVLFSGAAVAVAGDAGVSLLPEMTAEASDEGTNGRSRLRSPAPVETSSASRRPDGSRFSPPSPTEALWEIGILRTEPPADGAPSDGVFNGSDVAPGLLLPTLPSMPTPSTEAPTTSAPGTPTGGTGTPDPTTTVPAPEPTIPPTDPATDPPPSETPTDPPPSETPTDPPPTETPTDPPPTETPTDPPPTEPPGAAVDPTDPAPAPPAENVGEGTTGATDGTADLPLPG